MPTEPNLTTVLLDFDAVVNPRDLFPTGAPAAELVMTEPHAFAIACAPGCGMQADFIRTSPHDTNQHLGHLDPFRVACMTLDDLANLFRQFPHVSLRTAPRRRI
jgi:hypothetical protein